MRTVAQAWDNWLKALESHGFDARGMTRPSASDEDIPAAVAALYQLSDGQTESWRSELPGATDLFPSSRFLPAAEARDLWPEWADLGVPFALDAGGGCLAVDLAGQVVVLDPDEPPRVVAPDLVAYLEALAEYPLEIEDDEGDLIWDAPGLR
ncbi:hypothetical protein JOF56_006589 [Kibdelosporangium banguiense]|uniref:SMI1/KNR4 family protein n=1 Tax=Kibdelosporangium banguiense TaxID=1365924 RepID=A0ABS4TP92_9PSEU|nr:SMI1/KNR4 family protein [Kibdelosporangium banguiense]MBP2326204.1 hypothetical protein [Kibdelosporangium banguiense]